MSNVELISQSVDYPKPLSIHHLLEIQGERRANAVAIAGLGNSLLSFRRLLLQVEQAAKTLNALGIGRNDRVAMVTPNGLEMASAFLAVSSAATFAPLNPGCRTNEFDFYLTDLGAKALIVPSSADSPAIAIARQHAIAIIELSPVAESDTGIFSIQSEKLPAISQGGFAQADDVALILYTSGTTARPKMVPLTHANLLASAGNIAATLQLTEKDRCLNVMPLFHIHGLVGAVLSSIMAGSAVACTSGFDLEQFFPWLEELRPTWYTAVPTMHQAILNRAKANRKIITDCPLRLIRSSSAPLPPTVTAELEDLFKVPVIEAYGMTEASHQIASNPLPPRQRKAGSVGVATGAEIAIVDGQGKFLSAGRQGEIVIRGANITRGYENHPEANREAFTDGWFRTGDQGYLDEDGYLFITGRLKEIINRGGEKISPREVDEVLIDHPAVAQVVTFAIPHPTLGEDVACAIVLHESASATEREIREFADKRLADFKVPRQIFIVKEIPEGPTGKLRRVGLAEKLIKAPDQPQTLPKAEDTAYRTPLEKALAEIWAEVLGLKRVGAHDNFFYLGGDSIRATLVVSRVRRALQLELSLVSFFEKPTVAEMALSVETTGQAVPALESPPLQTISREKEIPLSHGQERLWFIDQLEHGNSIYNRPVFIRLKCGLNVAVLEQCLNEIIRRHEILRTTFPAVNGQPLQVVSPFQPLALSVTDISGLPEGERESEVRRQATDEAVLSFGLGRGPLIRTRLLRLGENEHILFLTMHHIVFDGWSEGVLFQELAILYESFSKGQPSPLSELPIQYADFAVWQRQWLQGEKFDSQLSYWKRRLADAPAVIELPTDRPRPPVQTYRGAKQSLVLSQALTNGLKAISRAEGTTLFMTLLAAFQTLLHRYTGKDDIIVGSPVAGRNGAEVEGLIGFFVNTLILRTDLSGDPGFRELLGRVRKLAVEAYAHQDVPFEKLVEELHPERSLSHSPLFQVMFAFQNASVMSLTPAGLSVNFLEVERETAIFDLSLLMVDEANSLKATIEYNTDLFDAATISRMRGHFHNLVEGIIANPEQRLSDLPMLTDAEKQQLLVDWNDTTKDYTHDKCIHELFESQVERSPDAAAVIFQNHELTYRELNRRANQLAHYLRKLGVGPEVIVGICMERSIEMVLGLLAILKAGGAYMPIDPDYPKDRTTFMLEDSAAAVLLSQQRLIEHLPHHIVRVIPLDTEWETIAREGKENPVSGVTTENLAYVIFTSGSTGTPKGAMNTHRGIRNRLLWMQDTYELTEADRVLQKTPFSFDVSVWEFFWPLLTGACLVVARPGGHQDSGYLVELIAEQNITTLHFVPSMLQVFLEQESLDILSCLRRVMCSGEALSFELQERFFSRLDAELHNLYGPTEASIDVSFWSCKRAVKQQTVPIGRPIANTEIYLLDSHLQPVPVGIPGELYIGGDGVARGYLNRPDLTAEKFVPNPLSNNPGARLYQTGDLARHLPDGNIEFLRRIDHQVKIRGFRIELGEIEAALGEHPAVREAVVLAREDTPGDKRLVAYVVAKQKPVSLITELRSSLRSKLPEYMVPSAFVFLDALPLTSNGKIDRRNLPRPDQSRPELESSFVAPRTPVEELIAQIWAEVLKLDQVGIHDNFFELGGHSLLLTQVASRIQQAFQVLLPLRILFEAPTIADLSAAIAAAQLGQEDAAEVTRILEELKQLSPDEVTALLDAERGAGVSDDK